MKARSRNSMITQVAIDTADLPGPRGTQHPQCASGPFFAPSRVPVRLDGNVRGINKESPPPLFPVKDFTEHGSVGVCRHAAFEPARSFCVAGYCYL